MRRVLGLQFVRFLLVGVLNTGFSYAVYAFFLYIGFAYALANLMALLLGIAFSFRTQSTLVFRRRDNRLIFRFAACWLIIYGFNITLIAGLVHAGLNAYAAGAAALVPVTLVSYFVQRVLVFGASRPAGDAKSAC